MHGAVKEAAEYNACGILRTAACQQSNRTEVHTNIYPKCTPCSDYPTARIDRSSSGPKYGDLQPRPSPNAPTWRLTPLAPFSTLWPKVTRYLLSAGAKQCFNSAEPSPDWSWTTHALLICGMWRKYMYKYFCHARRPQFFWLSAGHPRYFSRDYNFRLGLPFLGTLLRLGKPAVLRGWLCCVKARGKLIIVASALLHFSEAWVAFICLKRAYQTQPDSNHNTRVCVRGIMIYMTSILRTRYIQHTYIEASKWRQ